MDEILEKYKKYTRSRPENLPEGHLARFEKKMKHHKKNRRPFSMVAKIAAVAILVVGLVVLFQLQQANEQTTLGAQKYRAASVNRQSEAMPEVNEASLYYQKQIDQRIETLQKIPNLEQKTQNEIQADIREAKQYQQAIVMDLNQNKEDNRLKEALIVSYRQQLEMLDLVITKLVNKAS